MPLRWLRIGITAAATVAVLLIAFSCRKPDEDRRVEIWVSSKDRPQIKVYTSEWWVYGSNLQHFNAKIGPSLGKTHTTVEGELTWLDASTGKAEFNFEVVNEHQITITILGVTETNETARDSDPKLTMIYPPGRHSFKKTLWVKYTYD